MANEKNLIIDDEEDVIELVRYNLNKCGFKVITATLGEEAITEAKTKTPDLIILELTIF
ncbi:response regulator [Planctomycetota bacterium]